MTRLTEFKILFGHAYDAVETCIDDIYHSSDSANRGYGM